jgi:hypothetical protein
MQMKASCEAFNFAHRFLFLEIIYIEVEEIEMDYSKNMAKIQHRTGAIFLYTLCLLHNYFINIRMNLSLLIQ